MNFYQYLVDFNLITYRLV